MFVLKGAESVLMMDSLEFVDHSSNTFLAHLASAIQAFADTFPHTGGKLTFPSTKNTGFYPQTGG